MISFLTPDLAQHPPRSARIRLGGFVMLPRSLDKARAKNAGKLGEYAFPNPMDKYFLEFAGLDADTFLEAVKTGRSDTEMLAWVKEHSTTKRAAWEIAAWSDWLENLTPGNARRHGLFSERITKNAPEREDIHSMMEWLDLDDYITFGGKA
jgi:hypothetical protein